MKLTTSIKATDSPGRKMLDLQDELLGQKRSEKLFVVSFSQVTSEGAVRATLFRLFIGEN